MLQKGPYDAQKNEPDILKFWLENRFFKPEYHAEKGLQSVEEMKNDGRDPFTIINPPPNAYMRPHIGNVSGYAYQDVFLRYNRMKGKKVFGQPGKDHAGIQGEVVLEKIFRENKKKEKYEMGREKFYKASYAHFEKLMPMVMADEQRIGLSSDYERNLFTLDPRIVSTVLGTFTKMFKDKMVYKGVRIVNWDPVAKTTLADIDTERVERETELVYIKYPLAEKNDPTKIKIIVFDQSHVLFDTDSKKKYSAIAEKLGVKDWKLVQEFMHEKTSKAAKEVRRAAISLEHFWELLKKELKTKDVNPKELNQVWFDGYEPNQELFDLVKNLREQDYRLGILSGTVEGRTEYHDKKYGHLKHFEHVVLSYKEKIDKTNPRIYELVEEKFGVKGEEILFIDDQQRFIDIAASRGWKTFLYHDNPDELKEYIKNLEKHENKGLEIKKLFEGKNIKWTYERNRTNDKKFDLPFYYGTFGDYKIDNKPINVIGLGYSGKVNKDDLLEGKVIGIQLNLSAPYRLVVLKDGAEVDLQKKLVEIYDFEKAYYAGAHIVLFERSKDEDYRDGIIVATTRAETMLGDTAVIVNPKDERYKSLIGKKVLLPLVDREIPIISSARVEKEFGTGAVKLTPAHSYDDYVMMNEWNLMQKDNRNKVGYINVIDKEAKMTGPIPDKYKGLTTEEARKTVEADLEKLGLIVKREKHLQSVMVGERSKAVIEQIMSSQWFIDVEKLKGPAIDAVKNDKVKIHPEYMKKKYMTWMNNLHDWPVSRSLWWGYQIPVWYKGEIKEEVDQKTGQIVETINGEKIDGIYDAVEKGLAKVQIEDPNTDGGKLYLIPGKYGYAQRKFYPGILKKYANALSIIVNNIENPTPEDYFKEFHKIKFDRNDILIAHSLGTRAIIRYLLDKKIHIQKLILIAPAAKLREKDKIAPYKDLFLDENNYEQLGNFCDELHFIYSNDDELNSEKNIQEFIGKFSKAIVHKETGKQHYFGGDYDKFPDDIDSFLSKTENDSIDLTIIRHAETDDNKAKKFSGWTDRGINEAGRKQTQEAATVLQKGEYDLIISSDLKRSKETAEIIADKLNLPVKIDPRIKERYFGVLDGLTWEEFAKKYPDAASKNYENYQPELPEGESIPDVEKRIKAFLADIKREYAGKKVILVTHTGVIRILQRILQGKSAEETRIKNLGNCEMIGVIVKPEGGWVQDTDVFDTWFSSGQWVYATLIANDLMDTFYPTDIMETAYDILELWVSRMIMLSLYTQGKIPFKHVYLHGLVKAPDGQKMSKSKGNVIQPEEIINKYGADSLRLMYIVGNKAGAGYPVSYEKLEGYKRFLNKIWNASKLVLSNLDESGENLNELSIEELTFTKEDNEMRERLDALVKETTKKLDGFKLGLASQELYDSFWHDFCDIYLEEVKSRLYTKDREGNPINTSEEAKQSRLSAQWMIYNTLKAYLKLLHPFVPFITETIWQELPGKETEGVAKTIMYAKWPK